MKWQTQALRTCPGSGPCGWSCGGCAASLCCATTPTAGTHRAVPLAKHVVRS